MHPTEPGAHTDPENLDALLRLCTDLAVNAASRTALRRAKQTDLETETKSSVSDLVTEFDRAAEDYIRDRLANERPEDGVIGEEGDDVPHSSGLTWIVDPIDGTTNFVFGLPAWGCSVAVTRGSEILAGAIHIPTTNETYSAAIGRGATRNGTSIRTTNRSSLETSLIATGFSYDADHRAEQGVTVARLLPKVRDIRRSGSAAYDLCCVAAGTVDAYYEQHLSIWDIAAGVLIAREAGARVEFAPSAATTNLRIVASTPAIFELLRSVVRLP